MGIRLPVIYHDTIHVFPVIRVTWQRKSFKSSELGVFVKDIGWDREFFLKKSLIMISVMYSWRYLYIDTWCITIMYYLSGADPETYTWVGQVWNVGHIGAFVRRNGPRKGLGEGGGGGLAPPTGGVGATPRILLKISLKVVHSWPKLRAPWPRWVGSQPFVSAPGPSNVVRS